MNPRAYFISGIGTGVGKTLTASILSKAFGFDYWKPVQTGFAGGSDTDFVKSFLSSEQHAHPETYRLRLPASPHLAAQEERINIDIDKILDQFTQISRLNRPLVVEGAGGLLTPLNEEIFMADLAEKMGLPIIIVSRNYLGSINHSLLSAAYLKSRGIQVVGWIFSDTFMRYEKDIARWSGYPVLATLPFAEQVDENFIGEQAMRLRSQLRGIL